MQKQKTASNSFLQALLKASRIPSINIQLIKNRNRDPIIFEEQLDNAEFNSNDEEDPNILFKNER